MTLNVNAPDAGVADIVTLSPQWCPQGQSCLDLPHWVSFSPKSGNPATGILTLTPACNQAGSYIIVFKATDDDGGFVETPTTLIVTESCKGLIVITDEKEDVVYFIDPETNQVVRKVEVGHKPADGSFFDTFIYAFAPPAKLYVSQRKSEGKKGTGDDDDNNDKDDDDGDGDDEGKGSVEVLTGPHSPTPGNAFEFFSDKTIPVSKTQRSGS